jgi:DNA-binding response OmpR family regulator
MAKILMIGSGHEQEEVVAVTLRSRGHAVRNVRSHLAMSDTPDASLRTDDTDIIVIDVTRPTDNARGIIRRICHQPRPDGVIALILCYSRVDHGPQFELSVERLGARYVYVG